MYFFFRLKKLSCLKFSCLCYVCKNFSKNFIDFIKNKNKKCQKNKNHFDGGDKSDRIESFGVSEFSAQII